MREVRSILVVMALCFLAWCYPSAYAIDMVETELNREPSRDAAPADVSRTIAMYSDGLVVVAIEEVGPKAAEQTIPGNVRNAFDGLTTPEAIADRAIALIGGGAEPGMVAAAAMLANRGAGNPDATATAIAARILSGVPGMSPIEKATVMAFALENMQGEIFVASLIGLRIIAIEGESGEFLENKRRIDLALIEVLLAIPLGVTEEFDEALKESLGFGGDVGRQLARINDMLGSSAGPQNPLLTFDPFFPFFPFPFPTPDPSPTPPMPPTPTPPPPVTPTQNL